MADYTEAQLKDAAKRALADGNIKAAQELADAAMALAKNMRGNSGGEAAGRIAAAKAGTLVASPESLASAAEADRIAEDQMTLSGNSPVFNALTKVAQGIPLAGQYVDELNAAIDPAAGERLRATQGAMERQYPKTSVGLQVVGGVAGSAPAALLAPTIAAAAPTTLAGQVLFGGGLGAATGALEGLVSGYGRGEGDTRGETAVQDAKLGGLFGAVGGAAAPAVGRGVKAMWEWVKTTDVSAISKAFGIGADAAKLLKADFEALDFNDAAKNLRIAGPDAMVADAGRPVQELLDASITGGGKASRIGVDAVTERAARGGAQLDTVMNAVLGIPAGLRKGFKSIAEKTAPLRKRAYDAAYNTPIDYGTGAKGEAILGVLDRVPPRTIKDAVQEANDAMLEAGTKNKQILIDIADDGSVAFRDMPNVQQLDELKKALGAIAERETDKITGQITPAGLRAKKLARDLKGAIGEAVPQYKTAVRLGGDKIEQQQALRMGRNLFGRGTTQEDVADAMADASMEVKEAARLGAREYISETLDRVRRSVDDPEADIPETIKLLGTLSTPDARKKLVMILGEDKAKRLLSEVDMVGKQWSTRLGIAANSATARRTARLKALDETVAPGVIGNAAQFKPVATVQSFVQMLTRATPQAELARKQEILAEVATALTKMRGQDAQDALVLVQKAIGGQPLKSAEAERVSQFASSALSLGGYQTATQSQRSTGSGIAPR